MQILICLKIFADKIYLKVLFPIQMLKNLKYVMLRILINCSRDYKYLKFSDLSHFMYSWRVLLKCIFWEESLIVSHRMVINHILINISMMNISMIFQM